MAVWLAAKVALPLITTVGGRIASIKENNSDVEILPGGVFKYTISTDTVTGARVTGAVLTVGLSEIFGTHHVVTYRYVYKEMFLGDNCTDAALTANKNGHIYLNEKKFEEAIEWFNAAFGIAEQDDDIQIYNDRTNFADAHTLNREGDALFKLGYYDEAIVKYKGAFEKCPLTDFNYLNKYIYNEVNSLNRQGLDFLNNKKYACAASKFDAAYARCTSVYCSRNLFKDNMNLAKAEALNEVGEKLHNETKYAEAILKFKAAKSQCPSSKANYVDKYINNKAKSLNSEGVELFDQGDYVEAAGKFKAAHKRCRNDYCTKQEFIDNMNQASAETLSKEGDRLHGVRKYAEAILQYQASYEKYACAASMFDAAYARCTSVYCSRNLFKDNMNLAKAEALNEAGEKLHNETKYAEAILKYKDAQSQCPSSKANYLDKYINNEAKSLNSEGVELFDQGDYVEAADKFEAAHQRCTNDHCTKQEFIDNMNQANSETLSKEGDRLHDVGNYAEAILQYQASYNNYSCSKYRNKEANSLNAQGLNFLGLGKYAYAADKFTAAYEKSTVDSDKEAFQDNTNYAKAEIFNEEADKLFNEKSYTEAIIKYEAAYNQFPIGTSYNPSKYHNNIAKSLNAQGSELLTAGDFADAAEKFNAAYQICASVCSDKQKFIDNMNHAQAEALNKEGDQLCEEGKYEKAFSIYEDAFNKSPNNEENSLHLYKNNMANALYYMGLNYYDTGNFLEAENCFNKAYSECTSGFKKEASFKCMRDKLLAERDTSACIFKRAQYLIAEGMPDVENPNWENTIVIGNSLGGKSTVINYLLSNPLTVKKDRIGKKFKIFAVDNKAGPEIGATFSSTTTIPKKWYKPNAVYTKAIWDCPGFADNRGLEIDISNASLLSKLLSNATNIKLVLIVDFGDIDGNAARFVDLIKQVKCLFGDLNKIKHCSLLLVTKVDDHNVDELADVIEAIANNIKDPGLDKTFIRHLANKKQIAIFERPKEEGMLNKEGATVISEEISKLGSTQKLDVKVGIAPDTKVFILTNRTLLLKELGETLKVLPLKLDSALDVMRIFTTNDIDVIRIEMIKMAEVLNLNDPESNIKDLIKRIPNIFKGQKSWINYKNYVSEKEIKALSDKVDLVFFVESICYQQTLEFDDFRTSLIIAWYELEKKITIRHLELLKLEDIISREEMLEQMRNVEKKANVQREKLNKHNDKIKEVRNNFNTEIAEILKQGNDAKLLSRKKQELEDKIKQLRIRSNED